MQENVSSSTRSKRTLTVYRVLVLTIHMYSEYYKQDVKGTKIKQPEDPEVIRKHDKER
jgi:hypothetical protein